MENYNLLKKQPPTLILDLSATGIAVARILQSHGVEVYGADIHGRAIGRFSRYIKKPTFGYEVELGLKFLEDLKNFSQMFSKKLVLIPSSDIFIEFVSKHFEELSRYYHMQDSLNNEVCNKFLNKREFYKMCDKCGISYPKTIYFEDEESLDYILEYLRLPILVKPNLIHKWKRYLKGKKVIEIKTYDDLNLVFRNKRELLKDSLLQEVIPGPETNIFLFKGYFDSNSRLLACFTGRKIRQYPPIFGSASYAISCKIEEVYQISVNFLKDVGFKGICGTEFKYDSRDRDFKMIEINIRPQLWEDLTRVANREIVWVAYCDLSGRDIPYLAPQKNGATWSYIMRDVFSGLWHIKKGNDTFLGWISSYIKKLHTDALIDFSDLPLLLRLPGYALTEILRYKIPWTRSN